ncbi:hypothetical protein ABR965_21175 [Photorhabdus laumondii]
MLELAKALEIHAVAWIFLYYSYGFSGSCTRTLITRPSGMSHNSPSL